MHKAGKVAAGVLVALLIAACAPIGAGTGARVDQPNSQPERTLVLIARGEPPTLNMKDVPAVSGLGDGPVRSGFNAALTFVDDRETPHPYLATELPKLNTETWTLFPDGRGETIYRLHPHAVWHDGSSLTAEDFVFAWRVYSTPEFGHANSLPLSEMDAVEAPDPATVLIDADRLGADFPPLPRHVLAATLQTGESEALTSHPYWTTQYVGLGPWRLDRWEAGAFIEGAAFDRHVLGQPRIGRIKLVFNNDSNGVLSALLSGIAQLTFPYAIYPEQAAVLKQQHWEGTVLSVPTGWRRIEVQHRPDFVSPAALRDARVRAAFAHAIDRDALNEAVYLGESLITDTPITTAAPYYAELDRQITHYPYDLRRVEQLMVDAGHSKGGDGVYVGRDGARLSAEVKANGTEALVKEMAIIASWWRQAGFEMKETAVPVALSTTGEVRGSFTGFYVGQGGSNETIFSSYISRNTGRPENNWVGTNRGGFSNPEFDRLYTAFSTTLDRSERDSLAAEMARIMSEELPAISLVFQVNSVAVARGLRGPGAWGPNGSLSWNMHRWAWA
jgi:peptide/nickel transport system substrate-binding protein